MAPRESSSLDPSGDYSPIWKHPCFKGAFADILSRHDERFLSEPPDSILISSASGGFLTAEALRFYSKILSSIVQKYQEKKVDWLQYYTDEERSSILDFVALLENARMIHEKIPAENSPQRYRYLLDVVNTVVSQIRGMSAGDKIIVPVSWKIPSTNSSDASEKSFTQELHTTLLLVVHKKTSFSIYVCTSGSGLMYHPFIGDSSGFNPAEVKRKFSIAVDDIEISILQQSWFWLAIFRMRAVNYGTEEVFLGSKALYETLIPFLTSIPLAKCIEKNSQFGFEDSVFDPTYTGSIYRPPPPNIIDTSLFFCISELMRVFLRISKITPGAEEHLYCIVLWELCETVNRDLDKMSFISLEEIRYLVGVLDQFLAYLSDNTSRYGMFTCLELKAVQDFYSSLMNKLNDMERASESYKQPKVFPLSDDGKSHVCEYIPFEMFDGVRSKESSIELKGQRKRDSSLLPVQFSLIPSSIASLSELQRCLRHAEEICHILFNQKKLVRNAIELCTVLIEDIFLKFVPIPAPNDHVNLQSCIWRQPIHRELQVSLLKSLSTLTRFYCAFSFSLPEILNCSGKRNLTLASIVTTTDALMRCKALDNPSYFCELYSGDASTLKSPHGISLRTFEALSQFMRFPDPTSIIARTKVIDYFHSQSFIIEEKNWILRFDDSSENHQALIKLIHSICLEYGIPIPEQEESLLFYVSGEFPDLLALFPEFEYFRDIIFYFNFMNSQTISQTSIVKKEWSIFHAMLSWKFTPTQGFTVTAFDGKVLKCNYLSKGNQTYPDYSLISGAYPSNIVSACITSEDDVLNLKTLPEISEFLSQKDVEHLISLLTAPYLRIPLLLQFFSDPQRFISLCSLPIHDLVDSAFFEPSIFKPSSYAKSSGVPSEIPFLTKVHLSTPYGLLLNEIVHSPSELFSHLKKLIDLSIAHDFGHYSSSSSSAILFVIRLITRIESFFLFLTQPKTELRDVQIDSSLYQSIKKLRCDLRKEMNSRLSTILQRWIDPCIKKGKVMEVFEVAAHILMIYSNIPIEELTEDIIIHLLSAQLIISSNAEMRKAQKGLMKRISSRILQRNSNRHSKRYTNISSLEVAHFIQNQRINVLNWLSLDESRLSRVMEKVLCVVSRTEDVLITRNWRHMDGRHCFGRFIPSLKLRSKEEQLRVEKNRHSYLPEKDYEIEVNIQLGLLTHHGKVLCPLEDEIQDMNDFRDVFKVGERSAHSNIDNLFLGIDIETYENMQLIRLPGLRHDVQIWNAVSQTDAPPFNRPFILEKPRFDEEWIADALFPFIKSVDLLKNVQFWSPQYSQSREKLPFARLLCSLESSPESLPIREVVVFSRNLVVHVFNRVEYGGRFLRSLVFSSDSSWSYQEMKTISAKECTPSTEYGFASETKDISLEIAKRKTLVISRNLTGSLNSNETYFPSRFLRGLMPSYLIDTHIFWQNRDGSLTGYLKNVSCDESSSIIRIEFLSTDEISCSACISKVCGSDRLYLLNILGAPKESVLGKLGDYLQQIEDFSHILVWSKSSVASVNSLCSVDIIEFPRLKLSFESKVYSDGQTRFVSLDHAGMYLSNRLCDFEYQILKGLSQTILLVNEHDEVKCLLPAYLPVNVASSDSNVDFRLNRFCSSWYSSLSSQAFSFSLKSFSRFCLFSNRASVLYVLFFQLLLRRYTNFLQILENCILNSPWSTEELNIFRLFNDNIIDCHPDAHACKLKMLFKSALCELPCSWNFTYEMLQYIKKKEFVSASCRLTLDEELHILSRLKGNQPNLQDRMLILSAIIERHDSFPLVSYIPSVPNLQEFDTVLDKSCLDFDEEDVFRESKLNYEKPESMSPIQVVEFLDSWILRGIRLKDCGGNLGFLFIYELLTNSADLKLNPIDSTYHLGRLISRLLPYSEVSSHSLNMSVIRVLGVNPALALYKMIPKVGERKKNKFLKPLPRFTSENSKRYVELLQAFREWIQQESANIFWGDAFSDTYSEPVLPCYCPCLPTIETLSRCWIVPRVINRQCFSRKLSIIDLPTLGLSKSDAELLSSLPLANIRVAEFFTTTVRNSVLDSEFSVDLSKHPICSAKMGKQYIDKIIQDFRRANDYNSDEVIHTIKESSKAQENLKELQQLLLTLRNQDIEILNSSSSRVIEFANDIGLSQKSESLLSQDDPVLKSQLVFQMRRIAGLEALISFDYLVASLLSETSDLDLMQINPFLCDVDHIFSAVAFVLLRSIRIHQINKCMSLIDEMLSQFRGASSTDIKFSIACASNDLYEELVRPRTYFSDLITDNVSSYVMYDPAILNFEFLNGVSLDNMDINFIKSVQKSFINRDERGICQTLSLKVNKECIISLLLWIISERTVCNKGGLSVFLVSEVTFNRYYQKFKEQLSLNLTKPVVPLLFDRHTEISKELFYELKNAAMNKAVVISHPSCIESLFLKVVDVINQLDAQTVRQTYSEDCLKSLQKQFRLGVSLLKLFESGMVLIDDLDLVLNPLKSRVAFLSGERTPIELCKSEVYGDGWRWQVPFRLLDFVLYPSTQTSVYFQQENFCPDKKAVLESFAMEVNVGLRKGLIQESPHFLLLSNNFYHSKLKSIIIEWFLQWICEFSVNELPVKVIKDILSSPSFDQNRTLECLNVKGKVELSLILHLGYCWIHNYLPYILSKRNRIFYGLLSPADVSQALRKHPRSPLSRKLGAVPFDAHNTPSSLAEFENIDILIGLTILAYRYEGLRESDFHSTLKILRSNLSRENGVIQKRPSTAMYNCWIKIAQFLGKGAFSSQFEIEKNSLIMPLHLIDTNDPKIVSFIYKNLRNVPAVSYFYLNTVVFPELTKRGNTKHSSTGNDLSGTLIFNRRVGLSLSSKQYLLSKFDDIHHQTSMSDSIHFRALFSSRYIFVDSLACNKAWSVETLLSRVTSSYHALIDVGALVIGMTNYDVAKYLLQKSPTSINGVVFYENDSRMIILKDQLRVMPFLNMSLFPAHSYLEFYDHRHITDVQIKFPSDCKVLITLGNDSIFSDLLRCSFGLKNLGNGHGIGLAFHSETKHLIAKEVQLCTLKSKILDESYLMNIESDHQASEYILNEVLCWLIVSDIKRDILNAKLLNEQRSSSVWRERAVSNIRNLSVEDYSPDSEKLRSIISVFRENQDFSIGNDLAEITPLSVLKSAHKDLLLNSDKRELDRLHQQFSYSDISILSELDGNIDDLLGFGAVLIQEEELIASQDSETSVFIDLDLTAYAEHSDTFKFNDNKVIHRTDLHPSLHSWTLECLSMKNPPSELVDGNKFPFYCVSNLSISSDSDNSSSEKNFLRFPPTLLVSKNIHTHLSSLKKSSSRIKNSNILLEYIPDLNALRYGQKSPASDNALLERQLTNVKKSFDLFDSDADGYISQEEFIHLLEAANVSIDKFDSSAGLDSVGLKITFPLSLNDFLQFMPFQLSSSCVANRFFVIISLSEAEALRAFIHSNRGENIDMKHSFALRVGGILWDKMDNFIPAGDSIVNGPLQCSRFFNSEVNFTGEELLSLARSLSNNELYTRLSFAEAIQSLQRQSYRDLNSIRLGLLFRMTDEFELFELRALISFVKYRLQKMNMTVYDAFQTFDIQGDGIIDCSELYGSLEWLGISLNPEVVYQIVRYIDGTGEGKIRFDDFCKLFSRQKSYLPGLELDNSRVFIRPSVDRKPIKELQKSYSSGLSKSVQFPVSFGSFTALKLRAKPIESWTFVWDSSGSKTPKGISIWMPALESNKRTGILRKSKIKTCIGHYICDKGPAKIFGGKKKVSSSLKGRTLEISALSKSRLKKVTTLPLSELNHLLPYPVKFKLVWSFFDADTHLFVWHPIPPSGFVTLGMIATTSETVPALDSIRCVPLSWTKEVVDPPKCIWEEIGSGGRRGSFWSVNSLGLLWCTEGLNPPVGPFYDIPETKIVVDETSESTVKDSPSLNSPAMSDIFSVNSEMMMSQTIDSTSFMVTLKGETLGDANLGADVNPDLVKDWESHFDDTTGEYFYFNTITGETSWEIPSGVNISGSISEGDRPNLRKNFVAEKRHESSPEYDSSRSTSPMSLESYNTTVNTAIPELRALPENWAEAVDPDSGAIYYYNEETGETQWEMPE